MMRLLAAVMLLGAALAGALPAAAKTRGLLFGVSDYPNLPKDKALSAPKNDVQRFKQALAARGIAETDVTVLADGVDGAQGLPTRSAILDALKRLGDEAENGDFVIIYGTGHGARQKSQSGRKLDGLDQLFLPRDMAPDAATGGFRNAIVSVEFGAALDVIRKKGADVWFVLDSCFSGSATRNVGDGVREKMVDPALIGLSVATSLMPDQALPLADLPPLPPDAGKLVAFYASQPNETAREVALPPNLPLEKRAWGSIFTLALTKTMAKHPTLSYRQLLNETGRLLRADAAFQARQTPSFEGNGLDQSLPGAKEGGAGDLWRVKGGLLHLGQLEGLEDGAIVALYADADGASLLGHAETVETGPLQARLVPFKAGCDPLKSACPRDEKAAFATKAAYARLAKPAPGAGLRLAAARLRAKVPDDKVAALKQTLLALSTTALKGRIVLDDAAPDLIPWLDQDGLRLMPNGIDPASGESGPAVQFDLPGADDFSMRLSRALLRARQVQMLQRLSTQQDGLSSALNIEIEQRRYPMQNGACAFAPEAGALISDVSPIEPCHRMTIRLENRGKSAVFPMIFFLDDGWNLHARRPACPVGLSVADRLEPGRILSVEVPYHPRAFRAGKAPQTSNGVFVAGIPFREGEVDLPNLCGMLAFNDGRGQTRGLHDDDDLEALFGGTSRATSRLSLDGASLALRFWPVNQPIK